MQVTFGDDGSGFSNAYPRFLLLPLKINIGEDWPPFMLPLALSLRLRDDEDESLGSRNLSTQPGLRIDFEDILADEKEQNREVKQTKRSVESRWGL